MAYLHAAKKFKPEDPNTFVPTRLVYTDVQLDANGKYHVDLQDRRMLLGRTMEMCLDELYIKGEDLFNILEDTRHVLTAEFPVTPPSSPAPADSTPPTSPTPSGRPTQSKPDFIFSPSFNVKRETVSVRSVGDPDEIMTYLPNSHIVTIKDACLVLSFILHGLHIQFEVEDEKNTLVFKADSDVYWIEFDVPLARALGLIKAESVIPTILSTMYAADLAWSVSGGRVRLTRQNGKGELKIELPYPSSTVIWNVVSDRSSQSMFVSSLLVKKQFTGTQYTNTLAFFPLDPSKETIAYEPWSADWKRVAPGLLNRFELEFHDSAGRPFANLTLSFVLHFRTLRLI